MTDTPAGRLEPISDAQVDAEIGSVVAGHDHPAAPLRIVPVDRRIARAVAVAVVAFCAMVVVVFITGVLVITRQGNVIAERGVAINTERSRTVQLEAQTAAQSVQLTDQNNQALCRSQIANDYESLSTRYALLNAQSNREFRAALTAAASGDVDGFRAQLADAASLDPQIAALEPQLTAAAVARQQSVATCQQIAATNKAFKDANPGG